MSFATNIISNPSIGSIEEFFLESNQAYERRVQVYYPFSKEIDKDTKFIIMNDGEQLFNGADSYNGEAWNIDKSFLVALLSAYNMCANPLAWCTNFAWS